MNVKRETNKWRTTQKEKKDKLYKLTWWGRKNKSNEPRLPLWPRLTISWLAHSLIDWKDLPLLFNSTTHCLDSVQQHLTFFIHSFVGVTVDQGYMKTQIWSSNVSFDLVFSFLCIIYTQCGVMCSWMKQTLRLHTSLAHLNVIFVVKSWTWHWNVHTPSLSSSPWPYANLEKGYDLVTGEQAPERIFRWVLHFQCISSWHVFGCVCMCVWDRRSIPMSR